MLSLLSPFNLRAALSPILWYIIAERDTEKTVECMKGMSGLALILLLTACGGGGGGSSQVGPVPDSGGGSSGGGSAGGGTVEDGRTGLIFNSIDLEYETTYAQLTPSNTSAVSAWRTVLDNSLAFLSNTISSVLAPKAVAQTSQLRSIDFSEASEISKLF